MIFDNLPAVPVLDENRVQAQGGIRLWKFSGDSCGGRHQFERVVAEATSGSDKTPSLV